MLGSTTAVRTSAAQNGFRPVGGRPQLEKQKPPEKGDWREKMANQKTNQNDRNINHNQPSLLLPSGTYEMELVDLSRGVSQNGSKRWTAVLQVVNGPHQGRRIWYDVYFTPAAKPFFWERMGKLGITCEADLQTPPLGRRFLVRTYHEAGGDGRLWTRVGEIAVMPPKTRASAPPQDDQDDEWGDPDDYTDHDDRDDRDDEQDEDECWQRPVTRAERPKHNDENDFFPRNDFSNINLC